MAQFFTTMQQSTINERLNFLIDRLGMSVRAFSHQIGASDTNTRNYLSKGVKPNSDYLEKIVQRFESVNPAWLVTGYGEPFIYEPVTAHDSTGKYEKKKRSSPPVDAQGILALSFVSKPTIADYEKELATARKEIMLLTSQLADKERIIQLLEQRIT